MVSKEKAEIFLISLVKLLTVDGSDGGHPLKVVEEKGSNWDIHVGRITGRVKLQGMPGNPWHYQAPFIQDKIPHPNNGRETSFSQRRPIHC